MPRFVELVLTCGSWQEAQKIADQLLEQKLISSAEFLKADGIKLLMTTLAELPDAVEAEIKRLHGKKDFTLSRLPTEAVTSK
jgi:uncharacterized protein involved in tolerance to divalent cations